MSCIFRRRSAEQAAAAQSEHQVAGGIIACPSPPSKVGAPARAVCEPERVAAPARSSFFPLGERKTFALGQARHGRHVLVSGNTDGGPAVPAIR